MPDRAEYFTEDMIIVIYNGNTTDLPVDTNTLKLYPNPVTGLLTIESNLPIHEVILHNSLGQWVQTISEGNANRLIVNTELLSAGIYTVSVRTENGTQTHKIVVE